VTALHTRMCLLCFDKVPFLFTPAFSGR